MSKTCFIWKQNVKTNHHDTSQSQEINLFVLPRCVLQMTQRNQEWIKTFPLNTSERFCNTEINFSGKFLFKQTMYSVFTTKLHTGECMCYTLAGFIALFHRCAAFYRAKLHFSPPHQLFGLNFIKECRIKGVLGMLWMHPPPWPEKNSHRSGPSP